MVPADRSWADLRTTGFEDTSHLFDAFSLNGHSLLLRGLHILDWLDLHSLFIVHRPMSRHVPRRRFGSLGPYIVQWRYGKARKYVHNSGLGTQS